MSENNRILVGIDGGEGGRAAIAYAAAEAGLDDADLWLMHVTLAEPAAGVRAYPWLVDGAPRPGLNLLRKAVDQASSFVGADHVSGTVLEGSAVPGLVHSAADARLVVLGDDRRRGLERIVTGSVTGRVAGHAPVPVVVVPSGWSWDGAVGRVLVAIKDCASSTGLLTKALSHAADRDADLVVIHSWQLDTVYDDMTLSHLDTSAWESATRSTLEDALRRARRRVPPASGVDVSIEIRHGQPARVIAEETKNADLLIIGRRHHTLPLGRLGSTGRALIRESHCPIEVHPPILDVLTVDDLVLEHDGRPDLAMEGR